MAYYASARSNTSPIYTALYILAVLGAVVTYVGVASMRQSLSERQPQQISADDYLRGPTDGWYHITGGYYNLNHSILVDEKEKKIAPGEAPAFCQVELRSSREPNDDRVRVVVQTNDAWVIAASQKALQQGGNREEPIESIGQGRPADLVAADVSGMAVPYRPLDDEEAFSDNVAVLDRAEVIDTSFEPKSIVFEMPILLAGLLMIAAAGLAYRYVSARPALTVNKPYEWSVEDYESHKHTPEDDS